MPCDRLPWIARDSRVPRASRRVGRMVGVMKLWWMAPVLGFGVLVWQLGARAPAAAPRQPIHAPQVVLMEGPPDGESTEILVQIRTRTGRDTRG